MKVLLHLPYGKVHPESGFLTLLGKYLASVIDEVVLLKCNGVFSLCDRDGTTGWQRDTTACLRCGHEQSSLAKWGGLREQPLSTFMTPFIIEESRRELQKLLAEELAVVRWQDVVLHELCRGSMAARFGDQPLDVRNKKQEQALRRMILAALRMCAASRAMLEALRPDLVVVAGGDDLLGRCLLTMTGRTRTQIIVCRAQLKERFVVLREVATTREFASELLVEDVERMRADVRSWPPELVGALNEAARFLGVDNRQLVLPMLKQG